MLIANNVAGRGRRDLRHAGGAARPRRHAWIGAICYTLQIYFDFSGLLGHGHRPWRDVRVPVPGELQLPLRRASIQEFWRRWHMSLSRWFRDYLYVPLGGNRGPPRATYVNLVTVFFLCGLWHGANWTFVVWGLYHGVFLVFERLVPRLTQERRSTAGRACSGTCTCCSTVMVGWVFFRADTLPHAVGFSKAMARLGRGRAVSARARVVSRRRRRCWRSSSGWPDRRRASRVWRERSDGRRACTSRRPRAAWRCSWSCAACSSRREATTRSSISGSEAAHARQAADRGLHDDAAGAARGLRRGIGTRPTEFDADRLHAKPALSCP